MDATNTPSPYSTSRFSFNSLQIYTIHFWQLYWMKLLLFLLRKLILPSQCNSNWTLIWWIVSYQRLIFSAQWRWMDTFLYYLDIEKTQLIFKNIHEIQTPNSLWNFRVTKEKETIPNWSLWRFWEPGEP